MCIYGSTTPPRKVVRDRRDLSGTAESERLARGNNVNALELDPYTTCVRKEADTVLFLYLGEIGKRGHVMKVRDDNGVNGRQVPRDVERGQRHVGQAMRLRHEMLRPKGEERCRRENMVSGFNALTCAFQK